MIDIGAGTMDLLCMCPGERLHVKAVVASPVRRLACCIEATEGDLLLWGGEMGGGPVTQAIRQRAETSRVVVTLSAAATLSHDLEKVRRWGLEIVDNAAAEALAEKGRFACFKLADIDPLRIKALVHALGLECDFSLIAVCAQDHGVAPPGVSHLDFRHRLFAQRLDSNPYAHGLLYWQDAIAPEMNRLQTIAMDCAEMSAGDVFVMDSGMAAIAGAGLDPSLDRCQTFMVLDVATSHTVAAVIDNGELAGFFEYHTRDITVAEMDRLIRQLADGALSHEQILKQGGHGAWIRKAPGFDKIQRIVVTGPQRHLLASSTLDLVWGAPGGDNMMTGTIGLAESVRRAKGLPALVLP